MRILSPIVLFVYNRPFHAEQTLEALSNNFLADQSTLYIYCDGPKENETPEVLENIKLVREVCEKKKWTKEVIIIKREQNYGLADSIIKGVTELINKYGRVIVLEDDLVTSPGFLPYMNDALDKYADTERVMHISGYWFPVKKTDSLLPETFFYRATSCWGWATWKKAWQKLETDPVVLKEKITSIPKGSRKFNIENSYSHLVQLEDNITGKINTWAVKWYATVFLNNGLCLHPNVSLVNNIGFDNSGTHCGSTSLYYWPQTDRTIQLNEIPLEESQQSIKMAKQFHKKLQITLLKRIKRKTFRMLGIQAQQ